MHSHRPAPVELTFEHALDRLRRRQVEGVLAIRPRGSIIIGAEACG